MCGWRGVGVVCQAVCVRMEWCGWGLLITIIFTFITSSVWGMMEGAVCVWVEGCGCGLLIISSVLCVGGVWCVWFVAHL